MEEFDEENLAIISDEMDICITGACIKHKISPLMLSAILLARLVHLNNSTETSEDFSRLLKEVSNKIDNNELEIKKESLH
jgi:hypothetical protein